MVRTGILSMGLAQDKKTGVHNMVGLPDFLWCLFLVWRLVSLAGLSLVDQHRLGQV